MHRDAHSIAPSYNLLFKMVNHWRKLTNIGVFRITNRKKKIFVSIIYRRHMYFKILNKNTRVCTLSFQFYVFFGTILCWSSYKMKNILHVQYTVRNRVCYEQVDALETEITEEISVIESSFALMRFLEVLMNVYLP